MSGTQFQWIGKNVNLRSLSISIQKFFQSKGFETEITTSTSGKYTVLVRIRQPSRRYLNLAAKVSGNSNDFVVEFPAIEHTDSLIKFGFLTMPFGGGSFLLRGVRLKETLERLDGEFWAYVQEVVSGFASSAV